MEPKSLAFFMVEDVSERPRRGVEGAANGSEGEDGVSQKAEVGAGEAGRGGGGLDDPSGVTRKGAWVVCGVQYAVIM